MTTSGALAVTAFSSLEFTQPADAASATLGLDFTTGGSPSASTIASAGYSFVSRYLSDYPSKNLTPSEANSYRSAHIDIIGNWENDGLQSWQNSPPATSAAYAQGASHARTAQQQAAACGMAPSRPIYFSIDWEMPSSQQSALNAYFDGVASVIGLAQTGAYGGYYQLQRLFGAGKIAWGWQTYAWSYGNWDPRAQLRQIQNGVYVGGAEVDKDQAMASDFGQWGAGIARLVAGDFRDTGHVDVAGIDANNNLKLYANDGTGRLTDSGIYMLGSNGAWGGFKRLAAGYFVNRGDYTQLDVAGIDASNNLKLYTNDGTGRLTDSGIYMLGSNGAWGGFRSIVAGDFRNSGLSDIAGIDANNNLKLYTNDGTGRLTDSGIYMLGSNGAWAGFRTIVAGDFRNARTIDVAGIDANNNLKLYANDGKGRLTDSGIYMLGSNGAWGGFRSIVAGDFRNSGHTDIAGIDANNNLKLYANDGTGRLTDSGIYMLGSNGAWAGFR